MRQPVIIDTDPGLDDAIALFMAFQADNFDIKAITAVAGNQTIDKTALNALKLVDFAGFDIPVARGAERPLHRKPVTAAHVHGESGLGNIVLPEPKGRFSDKNAIELIYEEAVRAKGSLKIVALGPLTNIALALIKHPEIKNMISELVLMGGSCGYGNDTPAAEFNIYADPEAARIVFESGINLIMVGLDATHKALLYPEEMKEIKAIGNKISDTIASILEYSWTFYNVHGFGGVIMHDPFAMACAIESSLQKTVKYHVDIETTGEFTSGKTVVDVNRVTGKEANANVGVDIDRTGFVSLLKGLILKYGK